MRARLGRRGLGELVERVERAITTHVGLGVRPGGGRRRRPVRPGMQLVALHRQWHSLIRELKDAEQALGGTRPRPTIPGCGT